MSGVNAYIGIGSNLGDKMANINKALSLLDKVKGVQVKRVAPFYHTAPVGYLAQDWFINTVVEVETIISPENLLNMLLTIEEQLGRVRSIRWGPRVIDLDLLLYGDEIIDRPELVVPHPRMLERAFVMIPLADLVPDLRVPGNGKVSEVSAGLSNTQNILKKVR